MSRIVGKECQEKFKIVSEKMEDVLKRFCSCHPPAATTTTTTKQQQQQQQRQQQQQQRYNQNLVNSFAEKVKQFATKLRKKNSSERAREREIEGGREKEGEREGGRETEREREWERERKNGK